MLDRSSLILKSDDSQLYDYKDRLNTASMETSQQEMSEISQLADKYGGDFTQSLTSEQESLFLSNDEENDL